MQGVLTFMDNFKVGGISVLTCTAVFYMKKHFEKIMIVVLDLSVFPLILLCRYLSQFMLSVDTTCFFTLFGGKCISCGATHFVRNLTSGRIVDAFFDNQFYFICALYLALSLIVLNLLLFDLKIAKKILSAMYSIPSLICFLSGMIAFFILRNVFLFVF